MVCGSRSQPGSGGGRCTVDEGGLQTGCLLRSGFQVEAADPPGKESWQGGISQKGRELLVVKSVEEERMRCRAPGVGRWQAWAVGSWSRGDEDSIEESWSVVRCGAVQWWKPPVLKRGVPVVQQVRSGQLGQGLFCVEGASARAQGSLRQGAVVGSGGVPLRLPPPPALRRYGSGGHATEGRSKRCLCQSLTMELEPVYPRIVRSTSYMCFNSTI